MGKLNVEDIKETSCGLRGQIAETLADPQASHFEEAEYQLLKFHGTYQQDDRDLRAERRKQKLDKAWSFMVRTKMPSGRLSAEQYLVHDDLAESIGNGTLRLTTRQGIQLHGILKGDLRAMIRGIIESGLTTWGACGDVVRNTMGPASPISDAAHRDAHLLAEEISERFLAKATSYAQIWLDGEKLEFSNAEEVEEPIYGKHFLPRKFKIGIAVPPRNDADVFSQDIAFVPHVVDEVVAGYSIYVGGGFGMSHGKVATHPILAKPLFYVAREHTVDAAEAIVTVQRDYGNREERAQARMKYLVEKEGIAWFRQKVEERLQAPTEEVKSVEFTTVGDRLGWHPQGDGQWFYGVHVPQGRVVDTEKAKWRSAFRAVSQELELPILITPNANLIFADVAEEKKARLAEILTEHQVPTEEGMTEMRKMAHACVALPTCGLALAESERVFDELLDEFDATLYDLGLEKEQILVRMTGCPNGCARPYNADISFVGRGPNRYAFFVGGSHRGDRLAGLEQKMVLFDDIPSTVREILSDYAQNRQPEESFTDYWGRAREMGPAPAPEQFHVEFAEREAAKS